MEDESSISDPSESASFHSEHATNVGANLDDAPDCVIEAALEPPDSAKVQNSHISGFVEMLICLFGFRWLLSRVYRRTWVKI